MNPSTNGVHGWSIIATHEFNQNIKSGVGSITPALLRAVVIQALKTAIAKIKADPLAAGGPRFRYHHLNLLNFVYTTEFFILHYTVDEKRHLVYLRKLLTLE